MWQNPNNWEKTLTNYKREDVARVRRGEMHTGFGGEGNRSFGSLQV
jgi:hypothetical protein